ncbi:hypothetical protein EPUS_04751 [Endocarpon pusillum Z07020]|uniref:AATF leucine zipper-containing domain-containing protein n=1 Tax=Endocarpon pusillum (strain Z07020 / HMAS-L-300199) TaxID=1263415 RepID=U1GEF4_ENDPU|nr:uncharacterized protein EPUS_04751 [Endocarpon pusillum Z07020]ERF70473.1 hypothetical protein EPUS_04751 [Endocarpon pusillum Z07020]
MASLREQIAELEDPAPKDFDPESFETYGNDESHGSNSHADGGAPNELNGREHYEEVDASRLRRPVQPALGKRYASSRITRDVLISRNENGGREGSGSGEADSGLDDPFAPMSEESEEDPFAKGTGTGSESEHALSDLSHSEGRKKMKVLSGSLPEEGDEEIDSDDAFGEGDAGKFQGFKFLGSRRMTDTTETGLGEGNDTNMSSSSGSLNDNQRVNGAENAVSEDDSEASSQLSEYDSDEAVDTDVDSEAASELSATSPPSQKAPKPSATTGDRAALKALLSSDIAAVASSLSAAASADAKKGQAAKAQYRTFDRLLDARIKLQKGLAAANTMAVEYDFSEHKDAIKAAEEAALSLWNTITSIRHSFAEAQSQTSSPENNKKRKRPIPVTTSTPVSAIWSTTKTLNSLTLPHHRTILNKWSAKVRATNPVARESTSRLTTTNNATQNSITNIIDGHLATESEKLIAQSTATTTTNNSNLSAPPPSRSRTNPNPQPDPTQTANPIPSTTLTYDDSTFYQSLLRDLITSRSSLHPNMPNNPSDLLPPTTTNRLHASGSLLPVAVARIPTRNPTPPRQPTQSPAQHSHTTTAPSTNPSSATSSPRAAPSIPICPTTHPTSYHPPPPTDSMRQGPRINAARSTPKPVKGGRSDTPCTKNCRISWPRRDLRVGTGGWSEEATNEFFASLLGGRRILREDDDDASGSEGGGDGDGDGGGEALRLFRG